MLTRHVLVLDYNVRIVACLGGRLQNIEHMRAAQPRVAIAVTDDGFVVTLYKQL